MATTIESDFTTRLELALSPFTEMLEKKRQELSKDEWIRLVDSLESSVSNVPDQYVKGELPSKYVLNEIVKKVFEELRQSSLL
ncbi:MAG: hypothetical protein ABI663_09100 [Chryseolinea sp.]